MLVQDAFDSAARALSVKLLKIKRAVKEADETAAEALTIRRGKLRITESPASVDTYALPADGYFRADFLSVSDLSVPNNDRVLSKVFPPTRLYLGGTNNPSKKAPRKKRTNANPSVTRMYKGSR
jgi:hypothetical protein